jgi:serine/threonine protein kinase
MACLKPPFQAQSYEGLYRKVKAGVYSRIEKYSHKISVLVQKCLQVNEKDRWSAEKILLGLFHKHSKPSEEIDNSIDLLETIRVPRVLKLLNRQLPESQYRPKSKKVTIMESSVHEKGSLALIPEHDIKSLKCIRSEKQLPLIGHESSLEKKQNDNNNSQNHKG